MVETTNNFVCKLIWKYSSKKNFTFFWPAISTASNCVLPTKKWSYIYCDNYVPQLWVALDDYLNSDGKDLWKNGRNTPFFYKGIPSPFIFTGRYLHFFLKKILILIQATWAFVLDNFSVPSVLVVLDKGMECIFTCPDKIWLEDLTKKLS